MKWLITTAVLAAAAIWVVLRKLSSGSEASPLTLGWLADEILQSRSGACPFERKRLVDALSSRDKDNDVNQWLASVGFSGTFDFVREKPHVTATLTLSWQGGNRRTTRTIDWSDTPESIRGTFLEGSSRASLHWTPKRLED